ncbi:MAG TPA: response regulator transcription factor [Prolixibacteraceae bacterium]|nr:response regulator transcription factor [Prolixibacteraceae bacterium]HUM89232.1 response regulator transcription factor [Prolixibacteraceae bacterium]
MIQVNIVDDHKILVEGLRKLIEESGTITVKEIAYTANECRKQLSYELPNVLLLDVNLPDTDGVTLCEELKKLYPNLKILALTSYGEYTVVRRMIESGASGYILKNAMCEEVITGIETVANGDEFLCHEVDLLMKKKDNNEVWLSQRERDLLKLIVEGYTNPEIADKVFLSLETIKGYRKNLLLKLGAKNSAMLVKMAIEDKWI